jgi:hypothetical protein
MLSEMLESPYCRTDNIRAFCLTGVWCSSRGRNPPKERVLPCLADLPDRLLPARLLNHSNALATRRKPRGRRGGIREETPRPASASGPGIGERRRACTRRGLHAPAFCRQQQILPASAGERMSPLLLFRLGSGVPVGATRRTLDTARSLRATARAVGGSRQGRSQTAQARPALRLVVRVRLRVGPLLLVRALRRERRRSSRRQACYRKCYEHYIAQLITAAQAPTCPFRLPQPGAGGVQRDMRCLGQRT